MSDSVFSASRIVFGGIEYGFQNIRTVLRLAILPLVLIALIGGAVILMDLGIYAVTALSLPLLFVLMFTLPITCIHFANSGEIGHNITGHTTKGLWKYFVASLKLVLITVVFKFLAIAPESLLTKSISSSVTAIFQLIIHLISFYITLRLTPLLIYSITEGTSSVRHTLRLTRHRFWFLLRCTIIFALLGAIFLSLFLILFVPLVTLFGGMNFNVLNNELNKLLTSVIGGYSLLNVLWVVLFIIFLEFIHTMVTVRIANVLKKNPENPSNP